MFLTVTSKVQSNSSVRTAFRTLSPIFAAVLATALSANPAAAQRATLTDDAQVSANNPNQNSGSKISVQVSGTTFRGFLKFKLTPNLPAGTTGSRIEKATLKLYLSAVNTPGSVELYRVSGTWDEGAITNNTAPAAASLVTTVAVDATQQDRWIIVDITSVVKDWLDGVQPNDGLALVAAPGGVNIVFNSKENQATSHEPILEISLNHVATADQATNADNATTATTASTANALAASASVNGNQVVGDLANATINASRMTGVLPITSGGTGSSTQNFVDLSTNQTIAGNKTFSSAVNTNTQYNIGGARILHNTGASNLFAGIAAGNVNSGSNNAFFGFNAGSSNTTGSLNAFFGQGAGQANTTGQINAFFGSAAGTNNSTGVRNSFFGALAGTFNTTGGFNSFFGTSSAFSNTTGVRNSFFGNQSGQNNTSGSSNVLVGDNAGFNNTSGTGNTFVGQGAGSSNTTENQNTFIGVNSNGAAGIANATAIGANANVTASNTMVLGTNTVTVQVPGNLNVNGTFTGSIPAGSANYVQNTTMQQASSNFNISGNGTAGGSLSASFVNAATEFDLAGQRILSNAGASNMFVGTATGAENTTGSGNSFFGAFAGEANTTGDGNSFFGNLAGRFNTSGSTNSFFGWTSGLSNTTGTANSFFGFNTGNANTTGGENAFFGNRTGEANTTGAGNSFFGSVAGKSNTTGFSNSFFGQQAGNANTLGNQNSFFGGRAGEANTAGNSNSFFGFFAGNANTTGGFNSYFGQSAGFSNITGSNNAFFGADSGLHTTSNQNSFFGAFAGNANTSGSLNSFVGNRTGLLNTSGARNTFVGQNAGSSNTTEDDNTFIGFNANGTAGITNATAVGSNATVTASNTMVLGTGVITVQIPGNLNVGGSFTGSIPAGSSNYVQNTTTPQAASNFNISGDGTAAGTLSANSVNAATQYNLAGLRILSNPGTSNLFAGIAAGDSNTTGGSNSFFGLNAGHDNTTGSGNSFFGTAAGQANSDGSNNAFFGTFAGSGNTTGGLNAFFGQNAGQANTTGNNNAFFGGGVGQHNTTAGFNSFFGSLSGLANTTGSGNSFFGTSSAFSNTTGGGNSFFGVQSGFNNATGSGNTFVGQGAGGSNTSENNNTFIGANANGMPGISNATALGANSSVTTSDTMVLGTNAVTVQVPGNLSVANSFSANGANLTNLNASNVTTGTLDNARLGVVPVANGGTGSSTQNFVDLSTTQTVAGNKSFTNNVNVGNSSTGGSLVATNTVNRFLELGSNVSFDSVSGTVIGIKLKATFPAENYSYGIFHGSNVYPGALIFRKDDESISPGDLRNRLVIAGNGDILVNPGSVGIGTPTPANLLHLSSNAGAPGIQIDNTTSAKSFSVLNVAGSNPRLSLNDNAGGERLVIDSSGNVGIGTVAPSQKLEVAGNIRINGDFVATGTKSAVVTLADKREVTLYAVESTGNWFEDFGSARLINGVVQVQLDSLFAQTVNTDFAYHVFLTPNGNCNGLYVVEKTAKGFEVRELGGGKSNITFDYRIVARRKGYETVTSQSR